MLTKSDVAQHNNAKDCWIIIHGIAYDVTDFLEEHPGGSKIILKYAGKDATKAFDPIHPSDIIEKLLPPSVLKGKVEGYQEQIKPSQTNQELPFKDRLPPLESILNLQDFEALAKQLMTREGWNYYSSAADEEVTVRENRAAFHRIFMKPRVMRNVKEVDVRSTILGHSSTLPIYITATALGRLGHPEGETILTRAAGTQGIIQMIPTLASCSLDEIVGAAIPGQVQFFQLYVNSNREITKSLVQKAERLGCKALFITVDAPTLAKREKDMRSKFINNPPKVQEGHDIPRTQGAARAIGTFIDPSLEWSDLKWFRSITKLPIILKGIQCAEDAVLAFQHGCEGIVISNHGGRQLDFARSAIEVLPEAMDALRQAGATSKFEVYVDGGIRRGTDVFKALALGARGVGLGRPFLYAMSTYGQVGVEHAIQILKDELEMVCRLMGVTRLDEIKPEMLSLQGLNQHINLTGKDYLQQQIYEKMQPPPLKSKL